MAKIELLDHIRFGSTSKITAVDWQVAEDKEFTKIIDESMYDTKNLKYWHTPLKKKDGTYHKDTEKLYARFRVYTDNSVSDFYYTNVYNQKTYEKTPYIDS